MPKVTNIVIQFDDGSVWNVDPAKAGSIFTSEAKAKQCGHNPPYGKPPETPGNPNSGTTVSTMEGSCYYVNGVIVCP